MGEGCQIILVNARRQVLLQLRDDKEWIAYPGMWALPGGMRESDESPLECILREVQEEMGIALDEGDVEHIASAQRSYGTEHTFAARLDIAAGDIVLTEGQRVSWFSEPEVATMTLAYEDNEVLATFFSSTAG